MLGTWERARRGQFSDASSEIRKTLAAAGLELKPGADVGAMTSSFSPPPPDSKTGALQSKGVDGKMTDVRLDVSPGSVSSRTLLRTRRIFC
jgi:hypothetical protein